MSRKPISKVDFRQEGSVKHLITNPAQLSSRNLGWQDLLFELHQQPSQEVGENFAVQHIISCTLCNAPSERWLDGKFQREFQCIGDTAIIPANVLHRSQWDREVRFMALMVEPMLLQRVGQEYMNPDREHVIRSQKKIKHEKQWAGRGSIAKGSNPCCAGRDYSFSSG
jgi:AraC family transcriptional regulator